MKILFVYKYLTMGGVETVLRARLDALSARGFLPSVWFLSDGPGRAIFQDCKARVFIGSQRKLAACLKREQFDLCLTLDTPEVFQLSGLNHLHYRWIVEFHTPYPAAQQYLRELYSDQVQAVLTPSFFQAHQARALLTEDIPVCVCPNPLRENFLTGPVKAAGDQKPILGWVGRMDSLKNWKGFIKLAALLLEHRKDVTFWLIGDSPDRSMEKEFERFARELGVYERICWFRGVDHRHIPRFLDRIRSSGGVVLSTSLGESFGMTIAEAMARCCAVVVPDQSPFCEFVHQGETGFFYNVENLSTAVPPLLRLLENHRLRETMGALGRLAILKSHHPDRAMSVLVKKLEEISRAAESCVGLQGGEAELLVQAHYGQ
ncbi:MAG: glycosyltransferase family 4 protein [Anaerolineales bacterium]|nr:glycosyltransferase family 4 protein [Anaerolineales bacterium]